MTLDELILELENARSIKGGSSKIVVSYQGPPSASGLRELFCAKSLDVIIRKDNCIGLFVE